MGVWGVSDQEREAQKGRYGVNYLHTTPRPPQAAKLSHSISYKIKAIASDSDDLQISPRKPTWFASMLQRLAAILAALSPLRLRNAATAVSSSLRSLTVWISHRRAPQPAAPPPPQGAADPAQPPAAPAGRTSLTPAEPAGFAAAAAAVPLTGDSRVLFARTVLPGACVLLRGVRTGAAPLDPDATPAAPGPP